MKSGIWHLAGISLLCLNISTQALAGDEPPRDQIRGNSGGQQREQPNASQQLQNQQRQNQQQIQQQRDDQRGVERQQNQQIQQQQNQQRQVERQQQQQIRDVDRQQQQQIQQQQTQQRQVERQQQQQIQQQQNQQRQLQRDQLQQRQDNLPIQSGPGEARQTQPPRQGYYQDNGPRGNRGDNRGDNRPNDHWTGRPDGHGNGWGPGPQYRPGFVSDRVPGSYSRVPYRGQDYYYSDGYWYRPQGPRYVVVTPPYGMRVRSLPSYSQEVWVGSALFFLAAGTYYTYENDTADYVVAYPPQNVEPVYTQQAPAASPYDPIAYPNNGQNAEQVAQDKYDCYRWSVEQSSFDPQDPNSPHAPMMIQVYRRSMVACLMGRGYTIN